MSKKRKYTTWQHIRYFSHAVLFYMFFYLFKSLPLDTASFLGGAIARLIGPWMRLSRMAEANLKKVFPEHSAQERRRLLLKMWENSGRVFAEYPHIQTIITGSRIKIAHQEIHQKVISPNTPQILVSGHIGNWELLIPHLVAKGLPITSMYKPPHNPYVEKIMMRARYIPQGKWISTNNIAALRSAIKNCQTFGMLIDQRHQRDKTNLDVTFFNFKAKTITLHTRLALRLRWPLSVGYMERLKGAWFRIVFDPPLELPNSGNFERDVQELTQTVNDTIEKWVRQHPEQWIWTHRRWNQ